MTKPFAIRRKGFFNLFRFKRKVRLSLFYENLFEFRKSGKSVFFYEFGFALNKRQSVFDEFVRNTRAVVGNPFYGNGLFGVCGEFER